MLHVTFGNTEFTTAILIKTSSLIEGRLRSEYLTAMEAIGLDSTKVVAFGVPYDKKKPSAACRKTYIESLIPELDRLGITQVLVADGEYFKTFTKQTKAEPHIGYVLPCAFAEHINACYIVAYPNYFYNPDNKDKTQLSLEALYKHSQGTYEVLGKNVLKEVHYLSEYHEIASWLDKLKTYPALAMDIEAYSLKHYDAGIGTIAISWDEHSAVVFPVDAIACDPYEIEVWDKKDKKFKKRTALNIQHKNEPVRALLKHFFETYTGTHIWHNASYDLYVLVYQLFMADLLDRKGMLHGFEVLLKNFECSQIITYLATNSCAGNQLGLKAQAHAFVGNYALDVKDIRLLDLPALLEYNAIDTCATWYVMDKNYLQMVEDEQLDIYRNVFKPCVIDILEMQLTGICLDMDNVLIAEKQLTEATNEAIEDILNTQVVQKYVYEKRLREVETRNAAYKKKQITLVDTKFTFNPNSNLQLQELLFNVMELPVLDFTDSKQPATGGKTLKKLVNHTDNEEYKLVIESLRSYSKANKVLTSFITAYKESPKAKDGHHYLFGSFKLGGTVSGRLSSANPNLQNQPSTGSAFAKIIKKCFVAPKGWVVAGLDFNSLEDYISALTTKDPMKLKVYEDGFCGHCLRAAFYFADEMPDIDPTSVASVNSIKTKYPDLRQKSKVPTFLLTYGGSWKGIVDGLGFSEEEAKRIEANYHDLYQVSDAWVKAHIEEATQTGYITAAFGLKVRTPLLKQVVIGTNKTPKEAQGEARTAGNALGQSWGLLNSRASNEFMAKVRASQYAEDIRLMAQIHDSQYFLVRDNPELLAWMNVHLVKAVQWQEAKEIQHPTVKLGGDLSIFYPSWADEVVIPNGSNQEQILDICIDEAKQRKENK